MERSFPHLEQWQIQKAPWLFFVVSRERTVRDPKVLPVRSMSVLICSSFVRGHGEIIRIAPLERTRASNSSDADTVLRFSMRN